MLQKQVDLYPAQGAPGEPASIGQAVYTPVNPIADVALPVGQFVFPVVEGGVADNAQATNIAGDAAQVLGFVEKTPVYVNYDALGEGTMTVPAGSALTVAVKGDYWAVSRTATTVGQKVLASAADGSISTGQPDATHIDTGWVVKKGGAKGEPIIISNWGASCAATEDSDDSDEKGGQNG